MIDIIINEHGGLTVAHDEKPLDGYTEIEIGLSDGMAVLRGPGGTRAMGRLRPAMLRMLSPSLLDMFDRGGGGRMIRLSGYSLAKIAPLAIRTRI